MKKNIVFSFVSLCIVGALGLLVYQNSSLTQRSSGQLAATTQSFRGADLGKVDTAPDSQRTQTTVGEFCASYSDVILPNGLIVLSDESSDLLRMRYSEFCVRYGDPDEEITIFSNGQFWFVNLDGAGAEQVRARDDEQKKVGTVSPSGSRDGGGLTDLTYKYQDGTLVFLWEEQGTQERVVVELRSFAESDYRRAGTVLLAEGSFMTPWTIPGEYMVQFTVLDAQGEVLDQEEMAISIPGDTGRPFGAVCGELNGDTVTTAKLSAYLRGSPQAFCEAGRFVRVPKREQNGFTRVCEEGDVYEECSLVVITSEKDRENY